MTRLWLPVRRWVFLGLMTLLIALILLPLRVGAGLVGLDRLGVSARHMAGVVWAGQLVDGRIGALPLGRMSVSLNPLSLLVGEGRLSFAGRPRNTAPGETGLSGWVIGSRNVAAVDRVSGSVEMGGLLGGLPVGLVTFTDVAARWEDGVCAEAAGRVRADVTGPVAGLPLGSLSGSPRCEGAALLVPLASATGAERLDLRLDAGGATASLVVQPTDPAMTPALIGAGFRQTGGGLVLPLVIGSAR